MNPRWLHSVRTGRARVGHLEGLALGWCLLSELTLRSSTSYPGSGGWRPGGAKESPSPSLGAASGTFLGACPRPSHHRAWLLQGRPGGRPQRDHRWEREVCIWCILLAAWEKHAPCQGMPGGHASTALSPDVTDKHSLFKPQQLKACLMLRELPVRRKILKHSKSQGAVA